MRPSLVLSSVLALSLTVACGGGGDGGGVTPPPATAASVLVTPSNDTTLTVGATRAFTATPRNAAGQAMTGRTITWTTSSAAAASISGTSGATVTATAANAGTTTIRATVDGKIDEVVLTVQAAPPPPPVVASVLITPGADVSIAQNATLDLSAVARDASNATIAGTTINWSSTNTLVASVSAATGASITVTPGTTGSARIIASAAGRADTVSVTVTLATSATVNMPSLTFSPSLVNLAAGGTVTWNNASGLTHNVTFLTGPAVTGGNIPNHSTGTNPRTFTAAGTYGYECTIHSGMTGSVVVQ